MKKMLNWLKKTAKCALRGKDGSVRTVWRILFPAAVYALAFYGVLYGLAAAFGKLFDAWGLTNSNLSYAPKWARIIVYTHTDFCYALAYLVGAVLLMLFTRGREKPKSRAWTKGIALGLAFGGGITAVALLFDSVRLERPLNEPQFSIQTLIAFALIVVGKFSHEALCRRLIYGMLRKKQSAALISALVTTILIGEWTVIGVLSGFLLGLAACALYERGGLPASTAFQATWTAWATLLFGFPGMTVNATPVYALYHVSDAWLTGGNASILSGLWSLTALLIANLILYRSNIQSARKSLKAFRENIRKSRTGAGKH